jgi:hypothetical protein
MNKIVHSKVSNIVRRASAHDVRRMLDLRSGRKSFYQRQFAGLPANEAVDRPTRHDRPQTSILRDIGYSPVRRTEQPLRTYQKVFTQKPAIVLSVLVRKMNRQAMRSGWRIPPRQFPSPRNQNMSLLVSRACPLDCIGLRMSSGCEISNSPYNVVSSHSCVRNRRACVGPDSSPQIRQVVA